MQVAGHRVPACQVVIGTTAGEEPRYNGGMKSHRILEYVEHTEAGRACLNVILTSHD